MKKLFLYGVLVLLALAVLIQLIPYGRDHTNPPMRTEPAWPDLQARALAVRACFDCHSNELLWTQYIRYSPLLSD